MRGVTRVAYFESYPSNACVLSSVRAIDGVSNVEYSEEEGGKPLTLHGIEKPNIIHRYWYTYRGINNNFYFVESYDGSVEFHHGYGCLNCYPPQDVVDTIYPFILKLEMQLHDKCEIKDLESGVQEYCNGVECPSA